MFGEEIVEVIDPIEFGRRLIVSAKQNLNQRIRDFEKENIRTVALRTGIVLSTKGGALKKMKTPIVTPLGNGKQYMPWIHIDDLCEMFAFAIENEKVSGIYNAVAPEHQINKNFSKQLAKIYKKPFLSITVPSFTLKLAFGELSKILLLSS